jgi:outer membrane receptor protein involved in Fe transport
MQSTSPIRQAKCISENKRGYTYGSLIRIVGSAGLVAALTMSGIGAARAQVTGPSDQLTEIVVTAEKREERLQDTPISITAISGADLVARGISNTADALQAVPSVSFQSAGPSQTEYTIRGLSSEGPAVSTVGFYLDDVPMTAPSGAQNGHVVIDPDLYDLNRIEVLRGPQGTLYGSGSMGGTIKLVTNQPNLDKFDASAKVVGSDTQGGGFNRGINAMVNLPLIDGTLALRIVGTDEYTSGWIDRIVTSNFPLPTNPGPQCASFYGCTRGNVLSSPASAVYHNVNDEELKGTRATLRYQATDQFSLTASAFYQSISQDGLSYFDSPPGTEAHYQPFNVPEPFSDTFRLYNLVGEYKLPAFTITSVSSYWTRSQAQTQDISETVQNIFGVPSFYQADGGVGPESITEQDYTKQFSEELRLASTGESTFQWLIGAFYSDYDYGQYQYSLAGGLVPLFGSNDLFTGTVADNQKQTAEFGEASYKISDHLKATVGLRHYSYTQDGLGTDIGIVYGTFTPVPVRTAASDSGLNPKFTLSYDIVDNIMVYGTAAKGFRPGAPNGPIPTSGADSCLPALEALGKTQAPSQYDPDTIWSFELGEKATLLDRRLTIDAAVYNERWSKVQQGVELSCGDGYIDNVGTASVWGGEIEVNAKLSPSWTVSQSGSYTHAVITATEPGTNVTPGEKLLNVPDYTSSTSVVYSHPIADYTFVARASNVLVGPSESESFYLVTLPGYDIVRFRAGLDAAKWSAFVFVDNLTNRQAFLSYTHDYAENIPSLNRVATNQPRTVGLEFQFHY